jgi:hypothetical protein
MKKEYKNSIILAMMLILTLPLANLIAATTQERTLELSIDKIPLISINIENMQVTPLKITTTNDKIITNNMIYTVKDNPTTIIIENNKIELPSQLPAEVERLKKLLPKTLAEAEAEIIPLRNRFLMWTNDLEHIMWGNYRNHVFIGKDNHGKRAWGLYGNGYFVGIYDGTEFFWGKYNNGYWKAHNLFGEEETWGKYVLSPTLVAVQQAEILEDTTNSLFKKISMIKSTQDSLILSLNQDLISIVIPEEIEKLSEDLPNTYEATEEAIGIHRNKFLMWTYDLKNIMWGQYGNIFFIGQDNQGKHAWGIYGEGIFAGIYDRTEFFYGRYSNGRWKAHNLFRRIWTYGRYVTHSVTI